MKKLIEHSRPQERALLIGMWNRDSTYEQAQEYLAELELLARTAGAEPVKSILQPLNTPVAATFFGSGKIEEFKTTAETLEANLIIFDDELTPTQLRNIERTLGRKILDRAGLILEIFKDHARTAQAKAQVELASLEYQLPRLTRMWTHLSRERGGIGLKGAGEQEIETDRRIIREKIARLKDELRAIERQTLTRRKQRDKTVRVALVGYTNAGKSTIMNLLAKADVLAENKLFATLDTTVRKVVLEGLPFLLSDTVGFIRKLPHNLIESFKSTLDEVREADVLLHVVDISNAHYIEHIKVVRRTLEEIGVRDKPVILVFNKTDQLDDAEIQDLEASWMSREHYPAVFLSATERANVARLRQSLVGAVRAAYETKYPGLPVHGYAAALEEWEREASAEAPFGSGPTVEAAPAPDTAAAPEGQA